MATTIPVELRNYVRHALWLMLGMIIVLVIGIVASGAPEGEAPTKNQNGIRSATRP